MLETFEHGLPADIHWLADRVMRAACDLNVRLAVAESCTGGLLAALMTDVEGRSHGFDRGFVVYIDQAKIETLGVAEALIVEHGAVSALVAEALALGALNRSAADLALSVTGYAGKGAPGEEPGLVYFGLARRGAAVEVVERRFAEGERRASVRMACLRFGLGRVRSALEQTPSKPQGPQG